MEGFFEEKKRVGVMGEGAGTGDDDSHGSLPILPRL